MKKRFIVICVVVLIVLISIFCIVNALSVPKIEKKIIIFYLKMLIIRLLLQKNLSVSNKFISDKKTLMIEIEKLKKYIQENNVNLNKVNSDKLYNEYQQIANITFPIVQNLNEYS